ncbi:hypothetical protein LOZ80_13835 [Paenibacillus sp. HWE-109]|uniref:hypothetical protein n=1 Tax=Paenibacillus sp. HWE-109 TaxID=1306526 RepID=UPI001EDFFB88|nr:hypothetical protein [Paenibacillus sp. HWE-109]UKS29952.1 hypothetical protein LOZ80_13835 [Paenibacillus sp. HWE-109]
MTFYGIQLPLIIIAAITAFIGYQFNFRAKRREVFLKEISISYNEVYFPMYELLRNIKATEEKATQLLLLDEFFQKFSGPESKVRFIGTGTKLEYYYEFELAYKKHETNQTRTNENELFQKFNLFNSMMNEEFWEAHEIIYEDHLKFKNLFNKNPFLIAIFELVNFVQNTINFFVWTSLFILYFSVWNNYQRWNVIPEWWSLNIAIQLCLYLTVFSLITKTISHQITKKNRRKNTIVKGLIKKLSFKIKKLFIQIINQQRN